MRQMNLEPIKQSEVCQKVKNTVYVNTCKWTLQRRYWQSYSQGSNGDADTENRLVATEGEGGAGRTERGALKCMCHHTESRGPAGTWDLPQGAHTGALWHPGGWDGRVVVWGRLKREGTCGCLWLIRVDVWRKPAQYCKAIILQLKTNTLKKTKETNHKKKFTWSDLPLKKMKS